MRKSILTLLSVAVISTLSFNVLARAPGGGGGGFNHGSAQERSQNSQSESNSNGRFATDRDTGLDRAEDRMSEQGLSHEKATKVKEEDTVDLKKLTNPLKKKKPD
jgi:ABC-type microcin C transport system permease subunit YejB